MNITEFFATNDLEHSLLIGYYGGGNFGDELLLETLLLSMQQKGVWKVEVCYQNSVEYKTYHHDFKYKRVALGDKKQFLGAIRRNRTLIVGGGGLWGLDVNNNIFLLSLLLFLSRWILRKKVFLIGVGYYGSTSKLGHAAAWLAGKSANHIIVRDDESAANFGRISHHVSQDRDIAWQLQTLGTSATTPYQMETDDLAKRLPIKEKTLFIAIRRFKPSQQNDYNTRIVNFLDANAAGKKRPVIITLMEPQSVDPDGYALLVEWQKLHPEITIADFSYNPIALFAWMKASAPLLAVIAPQFHLIIAAQMAGAAFLPIAYDNKVTELLRQSGHTAIPIGELDDATLQSFVDEFFKEPPVTPAAALSGGPA